MRKALFVLATFLTVFCLTSPSEVQAETTPLSITHCLVNYPDICFSPAANITVGLYNVNTGKFSKDFQAGVGYQVTFASSQWYRSGVGLFLNADLSDTPNRVTPSIMISIAEWARLGVGMMFISQDSGGPTHQFLLMLAGGATYTGTVSVASVQANTAKNKADAAQAPTTP